VVQGAGMDADYPEPRLSPFAQGPLCLSETLGCSLAISARCEAKFNSSTQVKAQFIVKVVRPLT
jgi:hypothetical protein